MVVGVDVHKHEHTVALLDEQSGELATLAIANSTAGIARLRAWLAEHGAGETVVGVENAAGYGRLLCAALAAAGYEVLNVPAWRTHRDRHEQGPGKSDPADAIAIAQVVLRKRAELGPALEPELIRAPPSSRACVGSRSATAPRRSSASAPSGRKSLPRRRRRPTTVPRRQCCGGSSGSTSVTVWPSGQPHAAWASSRARSSSSTAGSPDSIESSQDS